tara:strand:+ start:165 stop:644 length:480 start_codon:yes stop_codon:yes gene_type:complete
MEPEAMQSIKRAEADSIAMGGSIDYLTNLLFPQKKAQGRSRSPSPQRPVVRCPRLFVTRSRHNCAEYNTKEYTGPGITSGILHMPAGYDKFEELLSRKGDLSLSIEDSHYDCNDLFALKYDKPEVDNEELYDLLCNAKLQEVVTEEYDYCVNLSLFFSD